MCRIIFPSNLVERRQSSVIEAIPEIDPDCRKPGDSDRRRLRGNGVHKRSCKYCIPVIKKKCDRGHCCWDTEFNGWDY